MAFIPKFKFNLFSNQKEVGSKRPDFSNSNLVIENDIPAGTYSGGAWVTEKGLSISGDVRIDDVGFVPESPTPTGIKEDGDDFDDI